MPDIVLSYSSLGLTFSGSLPLHLEHLPWSWLVPALRGTDCSVTSHPPLCGYLIKIGLAHSLSLACPAQRLSWRRTSQQPCRWFPQKPPFTDDKTEAP